MAASPNTRYVKMLTSKEASLAASLRVTPLTMLIVRVLKGCGAPTPASVIADKLSTSGRTVRQTISRARRSSRFRKAFPVEGDHRGMWLADNSEED